MNTGVEILLKRMETHPEDFAYNLSYGSPSRWMRLVDHAIGDELLTLEEHEALKAGLKEVKRLRFTELVMKELAGGEDEPSEEGKLYTTPKRDTSSVGLPQHILDAQKYQTELMRQHLDEHREALDTMSKQDKSKLMGMLKSYVAHNKKKATQR